MSKFKVGDKVKVVLSGWGMGAGDIHFNKTIFTVEKIVKAYEIDNAEKQRDRIKLEGRTVGVVSVCLELVDTSKHHPQHDLIVAWAKGETIQFLCDDEWRDVEKPNFIPQYEYRVKPINPNTDKIKEIEATIATLTEQVEELKEGYIE